MYGAFSMGHKNAAYRIRQLATEGKHTGLIPVASSTIWRWVKAGKFPKPFTMGSRCTVWDAAEVDEWIASSKANGLPTADTTAPKIEAPTANITTSATTAKGSHRKDAAKAARCAELAQAKKADRERSKGIA